MKNIPSALKLLSVAVFACAVSQLNAQNLVNDPGFEASADNPVGGNAFSPAWTVVDASGFSNVGGNAAFAHSGNNYANLGASPNTGSLSQMLTTTAGTLYTLSFWLANDDDSPINLFEAYFGGSLLFSTTSPPFGTSGAYQLITANVFATSASSLLEFRYRHDGDFWRLDDITVAAAPEGGAGLWLLIPLFGGLCLIYRRSLQRRTSV